MYFNTPTGGATHRYDLPDGGYIEVGPAEDAPEPDVGEYRLTSFDGLDLAAGYMHRFGEEFAFGDRALFDAAAYWAVIDEHPLEARDYLKNDVGMSEDEIDEFFVSPRPVTIVSHHRSNGDECYTYIPGESKDTPEENQMMAQYIANYLFGDVYIAEFYDGETGETIVTKIFEDYNISDTVTKFVDGHMPVENAVAFVRTSAVN